jgi:hypothetical protein
VIDDDGFGQPPEDPGPDEDSIIEEECRSYWENALPDHLKQAIADRRYSGHLARAYAHWAVEHKARIRRRQRNVSKRFRYYEFDVSSAEPTCETCGWRGPVRQLYEIAGDVLVVDCPSCSDRLALVLLPTPAETRAAAATHAFQWRTAT